MEYFDHASYFSKRYLEQFIYIVCFVLLEPIFFNLIYTLIFIFKLKKSYSYTNHIRLILNNYIKLY